MYIALIFFGVAFAVIIVVSLIAAKRNNSGQHSQNNDVQTAERYKKSGGGGARTYNVGTTAEDRHSHIGDYEEHYEKIVGSLGEVEDEGCVDLDGIRLIVNDAAYDNEEESRDYSEIAKAMVLGDIINTPRFKNRYHR